MVGNSTVVVKLDILDDDTDDDDDDDEDNDDKCVGWVVTAMASWREKKKKESESWSMQGGFVRTQAVAKQTDGKKRWARRWWNNESFLAREENACFVVGFWSLRMFLPLQS